MNSTYKRRLALVLSRAVLAAAIAVQDADAQALTDSWQFMAGGGAFSHPKYPGSDGTASNAMPLISATYGHYIIGAIPGAGIAGLGAYLHQDLDWRLVVALGSGFTKPRKESDDSRLRGMGDIEATTRGSLFASYSLEWFTLSGDVSTDIGGKRQGTLASFDLAARYHLIEGLTLSAGTGFTWASSAYNQTFFGIDSTQSSSSSRPAYSANGGVSSLRLSVGADYRLTPQWSLGTRLTVARLRGSAADSPITVDKTQNTFGVFAAYRF